MVFPVVVTACEDQFAAALVGAPEVRVVGSTREQAIAGLRAQVVERIGRGELLSLEVGTVGIANLGGKYAADLTLCDIAADVYRQRDAEMHE
jgi:hypothetical protein